MVPEATNDFLDKLDVINLPNKEERIKEVTKGKKVGNLENIFRNNLIKTYSP